MSSLPADEPLSCVKPQLGVIWCPAWLGFQQTADSSRGDGRLRLLQRRQVADFPAAVTLVRLQKFACGPRWLGA